MNESAKTTGFVLVAGLMLALAVLTFWANQPPQISDFSNVGQPFFENFSGGNQAESLEVYALDASGKQRQFSVKKSNGLWTIPSHYNYPAEAAERLANTAASLIGLTREALVGRLPSEHERLGVVDPTSDAANDPETAGTRLVLKDRTGDVLVDLIVGKKLEANSERGSEDPFKDKALQTRYYLRRTDENQTYQAGLQLELSTKFTDWIDDRLLGIESRQLKQLAVDRYELREQALDPLGQQVRLTMVPGTTLEFSRENGFAPWDLVGLNAESETMDASKVNNFINTLTGLKIAGVRPKYRYEKQQLLTADLKLNRIPELEQNPEAFELALTKMQQELSEYGFNVAPNPKNQDDLILVSEQGELTFGTEQGIRFYLNFGKPVTGDEAAIEIGTAGGSETVAAGETPTPDEKKTSEPGEQVPDPPSGAIKNRYVMIRVLADPSLLGPQPIQPVEPKKPEQPAGYTPPVDKAATDKAVEDKAAEEKTGEATGEAVAGSENPPQDTPRDPSFVAYDQALAEYEQLKATYELDQIKFNDETKARDEQVKQADTLIRELNERYGAWFYVVAGDDLSSLDIERGDFVQPKAAPNLGQPQVEPGLPPRPDIRFEDDGN